MSYRGRECEVKLLLPVEGSTTLKHLTSTNQILLDCYGVSNITRSIYATSTDTYWELREVPGQFIRARNLDGSGVWQVTVKGKDKGSNLDRIELEITTSANPIKMLRAAHGPMLGMVTKRYYTHWLVNGDNICTYVIEGKQREDIGIVIELESKSVDGVDSLRERLTGYLREKSITWIEAPGSLFEMLLQPVEVGRITQ